MSVCMVVAIMSKTWGPYSSCFGQIERINTFRSYHDDIVAISGQGTPSSSIAFRVPYACRSLQDAPIFRLFTKHLVLSIVADNAPGAGGIDRATMVKALSKCLQTAPFYGKVADTEVMVTVAVSQ